MSGPHRPNVEYRKSPTLQGLEQTMPQAVTHWGWAGTNAAPATAVLNQIAQERNLHGTRRDKRLDKCRIADAEMQWAAKERKTFSPEETIDSAMAEELCRTPDVATKYQTNHGKIAPFVGMNGEKDKLYELALNRPWRAVTVRLRDVNAWQFFWSVRDEKKQNMRAFLDNDWESAVRIIQARFTLRRQKKELNELREAVPPMTVIEYPVAMRWEEAKVHSVHALLLSDAFREMELAKLGVGENDGGGMAKAMKGITRMRRSLIGPEFAEGHPIALAPFKRDGGDDLSDAEEIDQTADGFANIKPNRYGETDLFAYGIPKSRQDVLIAAKSDETTVKQVCERIGWSRLRTSEKVHPRYDPELLFVPCSKSLATLSLLR